MASKVYLIRASADEGSKSLSTKSVALFKAGNFSSCFRENDFTAVKVHIGEKGNTTYVRAPAFKGLVDQLLALKTKPFITDTSTLYTGHRHNALDHAILADEHDFNIETLGAPFHAPDGLFGTDEIAVPINGTLNDKVFIASDIVRCQSIVSLAHCTGHVAACLGATLKTLGMGLSSRKGKMRQHASVKPSVNKSSCTLCGQCAKYCPEHAITCDDIQAHIDQDKCIGCAECVAVCRFNAVKYDWGAENEDLQRNVAEHALGALTGKKDRAVFFNYAITITIDCDCFGSPNMKQIVPDIGILASTDPVAIDKAAVDLIQKAGSADLGALLEKQHLTPSWQIDHGVKIGLGSAEYELLDVS